MPRAAIFDFYREFPFVNTRYVETDYISGHSGYVAD